METLAARDQKVIWHPFSPHDEIPLPIVRGEGAELIAENGERYLDAISSWWVNLHGHAHPAIAAKIATQATLLEQVHFAGCTHAPAIELAERLLPLLPGSFSRLFYSDNGSTAVEVALKMALQYWYNADPHTPRKKILCFKNSYHGDTFGAMAAAGKNPFHRPFWSHLFAVEAIDPLIEDPDFEKGDIAACIFEPLVMGAGGMITYPASRLNAIMRQCREHGVLTIADEVMTGFGRIGPLFACELLEEKPDIICLSKGITGGFLPLGATACTEKIYARFDTLLHGHSYTANPLACAAALASLDLLLDGACSRDRERIAARHLEFCRLWKNHPKLTRCQSMGTLLILAYRDGKGLRDYFQKQHILVRPLGNVLYIMPPYCMRCDQLDHIYKTIEKTLWNNYLD